MGNQNTAEVGDHVVSQLAGFVNKDFEADEETNGWRRIFFGAPWNKPEGIPWSHITAGFNAPKIKVHNARNMQAGCDDTAAFFDKHGFALLKAPTQVKDWNQEESNKTSDITNFYHGEIEDLVRKQLFPAGTDLQVI